jgi:hypothetical protein
MGPNGKLARAKQELIRSVEQLPEDSQFQIILFNRSVEIMAVDHGVGLMQATPENIQKVANFLLPVHPEGGTQPIPALKRALAMKPDVIFFLSDAEDLSDREVREVTFLNRGHSAIHVVAFGDGNSGNDNFPLHAMAQRNRGECRWVSGLSDSARFLSGN